MKFRLLTAAERQEIKDAKLREWHTWFAWHPIRLTTDHHEVRWLETVYRKGRDRHADVGSRWNWRYADNTFDVLKDVGSDE